MAIKSFWEDYLDARFGKNNWDEIDIHASVLQGKKWNKNTNEILSYMIKKERNQGAIEILQPDHFLKVGTIFSVLLDVPNQELWVFM